jgi:hypothetical protein
MLRLASLVLAAAILAGPALAQTPGPTPGQIVNQQQINQNRFQAQLQAAQLQQLQRQNSVPLQQADPNVRAEAAVRQQQIQQQIDQNTALQQQMRAPGTDPADVRERLQSDDVQIRQLQQRQQAAARPVGAP